MSDSRSTAKTRMGGEAPPETVELFGKAQNRLKAGEKDLGDRYDLKKGQWTDSALKVLKERYLHHRPDGTQETPEEMVWRVACTVAEAEREYGANDNDNEVMNVAKKFYEFMIDGKFTPNSPTLMNAGLDVNLQYSACYVLPIEDDIRGIFDSVKNAAIVHKSGGGTGFAFSRLRPKGTTVIGGTSSGPVSFLRVFDGATESIKQGGRRRGANMGILRVDHPDIEEFITCKMDGGITNFNISVAITEEFMEALENDTEYDLIAQPGWPKGDGSRYEGGEVIDQKNARELFDKIVDAAWHTGDPGLVFIDRINSSSANPVASIGLIEATNPCITGDTLVATEKGLLRMEQLYEQEQGNPQLRIATDNRALALSKSLVGVATGTYDPDLTKEVNGITLRSITHVYNNDVKPIMRVKTHDGYELKATPDHKVMTTEGWVAVEDLVPGDHAILIQSGEGKFNDNPTLPFSVQNTFHGGNGRTYRFNLPHVWSKELGIVLGWLLGDDWLRAGDKNCRVGFTFGENDLPVLERIKPILNNWYKDEIQEIQRGNRVFHLAYHSKFFGEFFENLGVKPVKADKKCVPESLFTATKEAVIGFLQGLFTADGTVRDNPQPHSSWVALSAKNRDFLRDIQLLLLNLGIKSVIFNRSRSPREGLFPYTTVNGEEQTYESDGVLYELGIFDESRERFKHLIGFLTEDKQERLEGVRFQGFYKEKFYDEVVTVEEIGEDIVYDLTEYKTHSMIANGLVVHQCGEQPLLPHEACNLGSINLANFINDKSDDLDWDALAEAVGTAVRFLDDVITVNPYPLPEIDQSVKANRRIGLGVMGWADLLFELGIPYNSEEALSLADEVMTFIKKVGHEKDAALAEARGPFPNWEHSIYKDVHPMRNSTVTTIAPTGSISIIAGASSGIEPIFALAFRHIVKQPEGGERELTFINPTFERVAKEHGFWSKSLVNKILEHGSIQGMKEVPEDIQKIFVTAHEIEPHWHVRMQAAFQQHTDNGVSKCVSGDTMIFTDQGIIPIESLYHGDQPDSFRPITLTVADNPAPVSADLFYYGGNQPVVGMETDLGTILKATPNHRVRVIRDGEIIWCRMDELKEGDYTVVSYDYGVFGHLHEFSQIYGSSYQPAKRSNTTPIQWPYKITSDLARAIGYIVSDGGFNRNSVIFTQVDPEVLNDYSEIMRNRLGVTPRISIDKRREDTKTAVVHSRDLITFFSEYLGCGRGAENKKTPACILKSGPRIQEQYIRGLTLDGYISKGNGRFVVMGTVSRQLVVEVQAILLNLGIVTRLESQRIHYEYTHDENRKKYVYNVVVVPEFRQRFIECIGYAESRKQAYAEEVLREAENKVKPGTKYVIPGVRSLAVYLAKQKQVSTVSKKLKNYLHSFIAAQAEITRDTLLYLLDICRDLKDNREWQILNDIATRKALYTPIARIWWDKAPVYDLQVSETHSFITNGFVSHNTVNLPNHATRQDIEDAYLLAYKTGCLGITVFRDGCKDTQVLHVGTQKRSGKAEVKETIDSINRTPKVRPVNLSGNTYRKETPVGTAYITVNANGVGSQEPFEVFINVGKAGSDVAADAEGLGRLISLILRLPSSLGVYERVQDIVVQLRGIGGSGRVQGFGKHRVMSLPDAVAQALAEYVGFNPTADLPGLPEMNEDAQLPLPLRTGDLCPECGQATLVFEEGCRKCYSCGYSEC
ncbi:MAG: LAGLIDADG family homing endonuclease [Candidatus Bipolaricaulia bacterium]